MTPPRPALVVLAAGLSSRYGQLKQVEPVGPAGEALMEFGIFDAWRAGVRRVVLVVRSQVEEVVAGRVCDLVGDAMAVRVVIQTLDDLPEGYAPPRGRAKPWGTAHALWSCRPALGSEPFLTMNADDFYGRDGITRLVRWARSGPPAAGCALVPYLLGTCLSAQGGVSRGLCEIDDSGHVRAVEEVVDLRRRADGTIVGRTTEGRPVSPAADVPCSLNLWGFGAGFHDLLTGELTAFLRRSGDDAEAEFLIPDVVRAGVARGVLRARALAPGDSYLGMTYASDRKPTRGKLRGLVESGAYPSPLREAFRDR